MVETYGFIYLNKDDEIYSGHFTYEQHGIMLKYPNKWDRVQAIEKVRVVKRNIISRLVFRGPLEKQLVRTEEDVTEILESDGLWVLSAYPDMQRRWYSAKKSEKYFIPYASIQKIIFSRNHITMENDKYFYIPEWN